MGRAKASFEITATDKTKKALSSVKGNIAAVSSKVLSLNGAIAGAVGVGGIGALIVASANAADANAKMADKIGIASEMLAGMKHGVDQMSGSSEGFDEALTKMVKRLGEFNSTGGGEAAKWIEKFNLDTKELAGMNADLVFNTYAESIRNLSTRGEKLAAMSALMGDESRKFIKVIDAGPEAMAAYVEEAEALGIALNRVDSAKIEAANDAIDKSAKVFQGIGTTMAVELAPYVTAVADMFATAAVENDGFKNVVINGAESIVMAIANVADVVNGLKAVWKGVGVTVDWFVAATLNDMVMLDESISRIINLIPGVSAAPSADLRLWADEATAAFNESSAALHDFVMETPPSAKVEEFFKTLREKSAENAKKTAADVKKVLSADAAPAEGVVDPKLAAQQEKALQDQRAFLLKKVTAVEQANKTEEQRMMESFERKELMLEEARVRGVISQERYDEVMIGLTDKKAAAISKIVEDSEKKNADMKAQIQSASLSSASKFFGGFAALAKAGGEKYFKLWKALAKAQAVVDTYAGATAAFKSFAGMGPWGVAAGKVAAAGAIAAGMARVVAINKTTLGSSSVSAAGGGGGVGAGGGIGGFGADTQRYASSNNENTSQGGVSYLQIFGDQNGVVHLQQDQLEQVVEYLTDKISSGDTVIIERDSRQGQELTA